MADDQHGQRQERNQPADQLPPPVIGPTSQSQTDPHYAQETAAAMAAPGEHRAPGGTS